MIIISFYLYSTFHTGGVAQSALQQNEFLTSGKTHLWLGLPFTDVGLGDDWGLIGRLTTDPFGLC